MDATELVKKHGSIRKAAKAMQIAESTLRKRIHKATAAPVVSKRKTLSDFRAVYDKDFVVPKKIKAALKALTPSGWEYEVPFARSAGVNLADLSNYRDMFSPYIVNLRDSRRVWVGSTNAAKQMREMV